MADTMTALAALPAFLMASLLLLATVAYLFRDWERTVAIIAGVYTGALAFWFWRMDLSKPAQTLLGRPIQLDAPLTLGDFTFQVQPINAPVIALSLAMGAVAFLLAARVSQGHTFVPLGLTLLAGYSALFLAAEGPLDPTLLTPLFLIGLSAVSAFILQAGRIGRVAGPLRLLIPPTLAFPFILVATWYIDQIALNPQDNQPAQMAALFIAFGYLLLLAPTPLHGAQTVSAETAPPVAMTLATLLYQLAVLYMLFRAISAFPFVVQDAPLASWLEWAGLATAVWGGVAAFGAVHAGRLWGYSALHDWGVILMVLATAGVRSLPLALFLFGLRTISMFTAAAGLSVLEQQTGGLSAASLRGAASRLPWNSAAFLLGGLGLVGFPLSAGFPGHWAAFQIVAETDWRQAAVVLIASGGAIFSYIRLARILFGPLANRSLLRERPLSAAMAALILLVSVSLALAPQLMDGPVSYILSAFNG